MNRVIHFEISARDLDKMQKFYQDIFGWDIKDYGPQMGNYRGIMTGSDTPGSDWKGIDGGMNPREGALPSAEQPINAFVCTIEVENIDETLKKIEQAGGMMATPKMEIPGVGWLAYRLDPEGNRFGVMQTFKKA
jgi:hypothetical protein